MLCLRNLQVKFVCEDRRVVVKPHGSKEALRTVPGSESEQDSKRGMTKTTPGEVGSPGNLNHERSARRLKITHTGDK